MGQKQGILRIIPNPPLSMTYRGYTPDIEIDLEAHLLRGWIADLHTEITFEGNSVDTLERSFKESVDKYLAECAAIGLEPEQPTLVGPYLYKFRRFDNPAHLRILTNNEIWFAAPDSFNDPFDCNIPIRLHDCPEDWQIARMAEYGMQNKRLSSDVAISEARRQFEESCGLEHIRNLRESQFLDLIVPRTGVFSLASHWRRNRAKLMWAHYTDSYRGFAVGFDQEAILKWMRGISGAPPDARFFPTKPGLQVRWVSVDYSSRMPRLLPCEMNEADIVRAILNNKSRDWKYEEEKRTLMMKFAEDESLLPLSQSDRAQRLPDGAIAEVILGVNVSHANTKLVADLLRCFNPQAKLYKARISDDEFDLERDEILL